MDVESNDDENVHELFQEHSFSEEVILYEWCPTMDVLAICTIANEVQLVRASWQKIWSLSDATSKVTAIAWKPDGKAIAIGYQDGTTKIFDVETGTLIHIIDTFSSDNSSTLAITCMMWSQSTGQPSRRQISTDISFMESLPPLRLSRSRLDDRFSYSERPTKGMDQIMAIEENNGQLNVLLTGNSSGCFRLSLYGTFHIGTIPIQLDVNPQQRIFPMKCSFSQDLSSLSLLVSSDSPFKVHHICFDTSTLAKQKDELCQIAPTTLMVNHLINHLKECVTSMMSEYQNLKHTLDTAISKFLDSYDSFDLEQRQLIVKASLLQVLSTGKASPEFIQWLVHSLGDKGIKQWERSVNGHFKSLETQACQQLQPILQRLIILMADLAGMGQWTNRFGAVGVEVSTVKPCMSILSEAAALVENLISINIHESNLFKSFMDWLQRALAIQLNVVSERKFAMNEGSVFDYLKHSFLKDQLSCFFEDTTQQNHPTSSQIIQTATSYISSSKHNSLDVSLPAISNKIEQRCKEAFLKPAHCVAASISCLHSICICCSENNYDLVGFKRNNKSAEEHLTSLRIVENTPYMAIADKNQSKVNILRLNDNTLEVSTIKLCDQTRTFQIQDFDFYDNNLIAFLLAEKTDDSESRYCYFIMLEYISLKFENIFLPTEENKLNDILNMQHCNIPNILNGEEIQRVESNKGYSLIANSTRGFVTILSDDRKKITIYDVNKS